MSRNAPTIVLPAVLLLVTALGLPICSKAQTTNFTWTGNGTSGVVTDNGNWLNAIKPVGDGSQIENVTFGLASTSQSVIVSSTGLKLHDLLFDSMSVRPAYTFSGTGTPTPTFVITGNVTANLGGDILFDSSLNVALASDGSDNAHEIKVNHSSLTLTLQGIIADGGSAASIKKTGVGTLTLSGVNTYTGGTTLANGELYINSTDALGTGGLTAAPVNSEVTLAIGQITTTISTPIVIQNGQLNIELDRTTRLSGVISGAGRLNHQEGFTLELSGNNTYSGGTKIASHNGRIVAYHDSALGTGPLELAAGADVTFTTSAPHIGSLSGGETYNENVSFLTLASGSTLTVNQAGDSVFAGTITGTTGSVVKAGTGTLTLSGANDYSGTTTINAGVLEVGSLANGGSNSNIGASTSEAANLVLNGGTLRFAGSSSASTDRLFTLGTNGGTLDASGSSDSVYLNFSASGNIALTDTNTARTLTLTGTNTNTSNILTPVLANNGTGASSLLKTGTGTWTLNGQNTFTGTTTINAGTLRAGTNNALSSSTAVSVAAAAILDVNTRNLSIGSLAGAGTVTMSNQEGTVFTSLSVGGNNTSTIFSGTISGQDHNALVKQGTGTQTLSGTNTYGGGTKITGGALAISADGNLGAAPISATQSNLTLDGGTLQTTANVDLSSNRGISLGSNGGTISTDASTTLTYGGIIAGTSAVGLTKSGLGTLVLSGTNTYQGSTKITGGTLSVSLLADGGTASGIGSSNNTFESLALNGGTLQYTGAAVSTDRLFSVGTSGGTLDASGTGALTFTGTGGLGLLFNSQGSNARTLTLTGSNTGDNKLNPVFADRDTANKSSLVKNGLGTWALGGLNTYTGTTTVNAGTLKMMIDNALSNLTAVSVASGATLEADNFNLSIGSLAGAGNITLTAPGSGSSTLTIGGDNTSTTFSGVISGTVQNKLGKTGTGALTLTGTNTYGGGTTISGGKLVAGNSSALGSGSVLLNGGTLNVNTGITLNNSLTFSGSTASVLAGNGTFAKPVDTGGFPVVISPGDSPGNITFSAGLTLATGSAISFQVQDANGAPGTGYDLITVSAGVLNLTAATNTITFNVLFLNSDGTDGTPSNFSSTSNYSWKFATTTNAITGFSPTQFNLVTAGASAGLPGTFSFTDSTDHKNLYLNFTFTPVPEPSTYALMLVGLGAIALHLKRRRVR